MEEARSRASGLLMKVVAAVVLVGAVLLVLKLVIGAVVGFASMILGIGIVIAALGCILWALGRLR